MPGAILINVPVAEVFDYIADGAHDSSWQSWVATSELVRFGGGAGATYRHSRHDSVLGGRDFAYRVVRHHRPVLLEVAALSLAGYPQASFHLEARGPTTTEIR